jgi:hypothetical protein
MKDKKFTPIKIGYKYSEEKDFTRRFNDKIKRFDALLTYLNKFISIEDKNDFKEDIYETFLNLFLEKEQANFPPNAPINSILKFFEVNTNQIQTLIDEFNAIDFDLKSVNMNAAEEPKQDFNIYTQTQEQNELFNAIDKVISSLNTLEKKRPIYKAPLIQALNFCVNYDFAKQRLEPNTSLILNKRLP